jgi:hypothetical protein
MRRLENDGAKISISEQNMELLQSARGHDEVQGREDLKWAIASDLLGKEVSKPSDVTRALLSIEGSDEAVKAR